MFKYKLLNWYSNLVRGRPRKPPYNHIVQVGDPVLRTISKPISKADLRSGSFKLLINTLGCVFKQYNCFGLSACQIGIPLRLFVIEINRNHIKGLTNDELKRKDISIVPQIIIVNPQISIMDYRKVAYSEACGSIKGLYADVPRFQSVLLEGLTIDGNKIRLEASGWLARIIQHEMDHINGILFTDIMDRKTLACSCWNVINERNGKVVLPYGST